MQKEFLRFLLVGGFNTGITYAVYLVLNWFLPYALAYALAYAVGIVFSYLLNSKLVFATTLQWKSFLLFPVVYTIPLLVNLVFLHLLVEMVGFSEQWSPLLVILVSVPLTFVFSRFILRASS